MAKATTTLPDYSWKDYEFGYCLNLIRTKGNANVGHDPKTIASYLRLQASSAFRDRELEITARLCCAATAINEDARNNHEPQWDRAERYMVDPIPGGRS
jgi:hypothetical protein